MEEVKLFQQRQIFAISAGLALTGMLGQIHVAAHLPLKKWNRIKADLVVMWEIVIFVENKPKQFAPLLR